MFSSRSDLDQAPNAWHTKRQGRAQSAQKTVDLTASNPTLLDFPYPLERLAEAFKPQALSPYTPDPFGCEETRRALSQRFAAEGLELAPKQIMLTASTSEAYAFLFRLLCDPDDEVLVPEPSYPLFAHLADFAEVTLQPYPLRYDGRWHAATQELFDAISDRTRAVIVVNPNNPTGSYLSKDQAEGLAELELPLISDEVFYDYPLEAPNDRCRAASVSKNLSFSLGGLSKFAGLPQFKLAWTLIHGPENMVEEARARLEIMADAFLSPNTPVQQILPEVVEASATTREAIRQRCRANLAHLQAAVQDSTATLPRVEGGWYAPVRLPATQTDEAWALALIDEGLLVQPGYFYDFPYDESWVVLSLIVPEKVFQEGVRILLAHLENTNA